MEGPGARGVYRRRTSGCRGDRRGGDAAHGLAQPAVPGIGGEASMPEQGDAVGLDVDRTGLGHEGSTELGDAGRRGEHEVGAASDLDRDGKARHPQTDAALEAVGGQHGIDRAPATTGGGDEHVAGGQVGPAGSRSAELRVKQRRWSRNSTARVISAPAWSASQGATGTTARSSSPVDKVPSRRTSWTPGAVVVSSAISPGSTEEIEQVWGAEVEGAGRCRWVKAGDLQGGGEVRRASARRGVRRGLGTGRRHQALAAAHEEGVVQRGAEAGRGRDWWPTG